MLAVVLLWQMVLGLNELKNIFLHPLLKPYSAPLVRFYALHACEANPANSRTS